MILPFRTIRGKEYNLEVDPQKTIADVKQQFSNEVENYPADKLKFILQAKILKDDTIVSSIKVPDHSYIVVHFINDNRPVVPKSKRPSPPSDSVNSIPDEPKVPPQPQPEGQNKQINQADVLEDLVSMGFEKKMCERALNLAENNIEVAVTLLLNGSITAEDDKDQPNGNPGNTGNLSIDDKPQGIQPQTPNAQVNFGDLQDVYDQLTNEEKAAVSRLLKYGSPEDVLQIYFACQKDEEVTKACLQ